MKSAKNKKNKNYILNYGNAFKTLRKKKKKAIRKISEITELRGRKIS